MKKGFGAIFSASWQEYRNKFGIIIKLFLLLYLLPALGIFFAGLLSLKNEPTSPEQFLDVLLSNPLYIVFFIIFAVTYLLLNLSLVCLSLSEKKGVRLKNALKDAAANFWRYLALMIVTTVILMLLALLLIVPAIIFGVYWIFATYVLIAEKRGVMESLKASKALVKGRWWGVFGYTLLLAIIILGIGMLFEIPAFLLSFVSEPISSLIGGVFNILANAITMPLSIIFFKNLYLDSKANPLAKRAKK